MTKLFTPLFDSIVKKHGLITAAVYGRIYRYSQMDDKVCRASQQKIARELGVDRTTINRHIQLLINEGYLIDLSPDRKNKPHAYKAVDLTVAESNSGVVKSNSGVAENDSECSTEQHEESIKKQINNNHKNNKNRQDGDSEMIDENFEIEGNKPICPVCTNTMDLQHPESRDPHWLCSRRGCGVRIPYPFYAPEGAKPLIQDYYEIPRGKTRKELSEE